MLAHGPATRDMMSRPTEFLGNIMLLIVGGNDTTRNSISGGVLGLNQFPDEYAKLEAQPKVIPNMVSEMIRWQTPVIHMRRTPFHDTELGGKKIRAGDKVVMWYYSANRDETVFPDAERLVVDRPNARAHVSFGFGIHRCMGKPARRAAAQAAVGRDPEALPQGGSDGADRARPEQLHPGDRGSAGAGHTPLKASQLQRRPRAAGPMLRCGRRSRSRDR
jgi:cytochrome P450